MRRLYRPVCPNPMALQTNYKFPENKLALQNASHGKCMYCESQVAHIAYGDVEHFRPKAADKYPHLQFEWTNLGYSCTRCNNAKKAQFDEACPLIDPYDEDPNQHLFAFGSVVWHKAGSERGAITIKTVDLNRAELVERRTVKLSEVQKAIDACCRTKNASVRDDLLAELAREADPDKEFSMFAAALTAANR